MHYINRMVLTEDGVRKNIKSMSSGAYNFHRMIWNLFPNDGSGTRDYVYSVSDDNRMVYCVSCKPPICEDGAWSIETKEYDPRLREGQYLRFRMKVNPIVANSNTGKHRKHDVVMDLKRKKKESGEMIDMDSIIHESVYSWITRKGQMNGFQVLDNDLMIHSYRRNESYKAGFQKISFSTVVIEGILQITDCDLFTNILMNGLGSSKGFGCGLVLVRRP